MLKSKTLLEKVNNKYIDLKANKYSIISSNDAILNNNERYVSLSNELGNAKFLLAKAEYNGQSDKIKQIKQEITTLEKLILTLKSQLPLKELTFNCNVCKDTGIVDNKRCKCFYKYLTEFALESLEVSNPENYDFEEVPLNNDLVKQFKIIKNYAENFPNTQINNLILSGSVGTGKTTLAKCILSKVKNNDNIAVFLTATELNNIFLKIHTGKVDRSLALEVLLGADLLIIDDLGTETMLKNVTVEYLLSLISERLDKKKPFIITTNLTSKELLERYNERFLSRLSDKSQTLFIPFFCNDLRKN